MTRSVIAIFVLAAALGGCGPAPSEQQGQSAAPEALEQAIREEPSGAITMEGGVVEFYDESVAAEARQEPSFRIEAELLEYTGEQKGTFQDARATIFGHGPGGGNIRINADRGRFGAETALLEGNVVMKSGGMTVEMTELEWNNADGVVKSENPVRLISDEIELLAESLLLDTTADELVLIGPGKGRSVMKGSQ